MSQYILSALALQRISCMLQFNSVSDHRLETATGQSIPLTMTVDRTPKCTQVSIRLYDQQHELTLSYCEPQSTAAVARFIQSIANGTLDTAINDLPLAASA